MFLCCRCLGLSDRLFQVIDNGLDKRRHQFVWNEFTSKEFSNVDCKGAFLLLLLVPFENGLFVSRIGMNWNDSDICVVVESIKHRDLSQQILTCIWICARNVLVCVSHQWSIEGLRNTSVKQQGCHTKSEHGIAFVQFLHDSNHHLVVGLFGQFVEERIDLIIVRVVLLANLTVQGD